MLVGHYAAGFIGKRAAPGVSLGTLLAATLFPDLLVSIDQLVGIEHARSTPGITAFSSLDGYDIAISHSLATSVFWSLLLAAMYWTARRLVARILYSLCPAWRSQPRGARPEIPATSRGAPRGYQGTEPRGWLWRRDRRGSVVVGAVVFSHWVLDFVSHRPALPLAPGIDRYVGLGLWNSVPMTFVVEGALWILSIAIYLRTTRATSRAGNLGLVALLTIPTIGWIRMPFDQPPAGDFSAGLLIALLAIQTGLCLLAHWVDRGRRLRVGSSARSAL